MASSNVSSVTNHFPTANEGFITTLSSTILSGATTVPLTTTSGLTNGTVFVGIVEPGTVGKEQTFTGIVDTAGNQITGVKWTRGTNTGHNAGVTIVDYVSGTGQNMMTKGWSVEHNQNGTHSAITATSITATTGTFTNLTIAGTASAEGWSALGATPNTVTANGNRSYDLVFNSNDLTDTITEGMRVRTARTVAAPVQCTSLNGTTQYYSKASPNKMTFTDDFVVSAWVKLTAYDATRSPIVSRVNGTQGWVLDISNTGQLRLLGYNAALGNVSYVQSYQSVPLNKWVHVAAQLDMSAFTATTTTSYTMFDGVDVPASVARAGTNPTALVQAGNFEIGTANAGSGTGFFNGKIAQVAIYSAKVTQATILASMNQKLAGTETNLASAYSFSNSITDLNTTTPNDLTANGSAVATATDSPFGNSGVSTTIDYGIVMAKAFSTNTTLTIQVPEGCTIPTSGGVSSMDYSINAVPYGFPKRKGKWRIKSLYKVALSQTNPVSGTWYNFGVLNVPTGAWDTKISGSLLDTNTSSPTTAFVTLSSANNTESDTEMTVRPLYMSASGGVVGTTMGNVYREGELSLSAAAPYYLNAKVDTASNTALSFGPASEATIIELANAYI